MTVDALLTLISVLIGLWAGKRMLGRSIGAGARAVAAWWDRVAMVSTVSADPARVTSSTPEPSSGTRTGTAWYVSAAPDELDAARTAAQFLALRKSADGWMFSANKIHELIGGTRADVLGWVREARSDATPPEPEARTPIAGRPYDPRLYHQDDPQLQYSDPPR
jgi:hypothetical protein